MEKNEIVLQLKSILVIILKHEKFEMKDELSAAEVDGWDSLTHMIIITEIEKKFQISFKLKELNKLSNLGSLINLIQLKTS
jgi:acyl carrier protein